MQKKSTFNLQADTHQRLKLLAVMTRREMTEIVEDALAAYFLAHDPCRLPPVPTIRVPATAMIDISDYAMYDGGHPTVLNMRFKEGLITYQQVTSSPPGLAGA